MLHYVHQLAANFVCLLSGAEQVVYSGFLELIFLITEDYGSRESEPKTFKLRARNPKQRVERC